jgi:hypothetical protein
MRAHLNLPDPVKTNASAFKLKGAPRASHHGKAGLLGLDVLPNEALLVVFDETSASTIVKKAELKSGRKFHIPLFLLRRYF